MLHAAWLASSSFGLVWPTHSCSGGPAAERSSWLAQSPTIAISPPPFRTRWHWHQKVNFFLFAWARIDCIHAIQFPPILFFVLAEMGTGTQGQLVFVSVLSQKNEWWLVLQTVDGKIEPETHLCISKPAKWFISVLWH
jgi:hypothetical protein